MMGVRDNIDLLMKDFLAHRDGVDLVFSEGVISEVKILAQELDMNMIIYFYLFTRMSSCSVCMSFVRLGHHDG